MEASDQWCPTRTVWVLGDDLLWHCSCCRTVRRFDQLVDPVLLPKEPAVGETTKDLR